jgi:hypothetical protein
VGTPGRVVASTSIVAALSFYDEPPEILQAMVLSLERLRPNAFVALDGRYGLFPEGRIHGSGQYQRDLVRRMAEFAKVPNVTVVGREVWPGGEIEKRNTLIEMARDTGADWMLVIDGDERIASSSRLRLALSKLRPDENVAYVTFDHSPSFSGRFAKERRLFRIVDDLHIRDAHYGWHDGRRFLWDGTSTPAADLSANLTIAHHHMERDRERTLHRVAYYEARAVAGVERPLELQA